MIRENAHTRTHTTYLFAGERRVQHPGHLLEAFEGGRAEKLAVLGKPVEHPVEVGLLERVVLALGVRDHGVAAAPVRDQDADLAKVAPLVEGCHHPSGAGRQHVDVASPEKVHFVGGVALVKDDVLGEDELHRLGGVDAEEFGDPALHPLLEARVQFEDGAVDGDRRRRRLLQDARPPPQEHPR